MSIATKTRRPRAKLVTLTDAAATRVAEILAERGEGYLRVGCLLYTSPSPRD